jgi:hypothetical protein
VCPGWTDADSSTWLKFFEGQGPHAFIDLPPFDVTRLHPVLQPIEAHEVPLVPAPAASAVIVPEPLVCTTSDAASAWSTQRAKVRQNCRHVAGEVIKGNQSSIYIYFDRIMNSNSVLEFQVWRLGIY